MKNTFTILIAIVAIYGAVAFPTGPAELMMPDDIVPESESDKDFPPPMMDGSSESPFGGEFFGSGLSPTMPSEDPGFSGESPPMPPTDPDHAVWPEESHKDFDFPPLMSHEGPHEDLPPPMSHEDPQTPMFDAPIHTHHMHAHPSHSQSWGPPPEALVQTGSDTTPEAASAEEMLAKAHGELRNSMEALGKSFEEIQKQVQEQVTQEATSFEGSQAKIKTAAMESCARQCPNGPPPRVALIQASITHSASYASSGSEGSYSSTSADSLPATSESCETCLAPWMKKFEAVEAAHEKRMEDLKADFGKAAQDFKTEQAKLHKHAEVLEDQMKQVAVTRHAEEFRTNQKMLMGAMEDLTKQFAERQEEHSKHVIAASAAFEKYQKDIQEHAETTCNGRDVSDINACMVPFFEEHAKEAKAFQERQAENQTAYAALEVSYREQAAALQKQGSELEAQFIKQVGEQADDKQVGEQARDGDHGPSFDQLEPLILKCQSLAGFGISNECKALNARAECEGKQDVAVCDKCQQEIMPCVMQQMQHGGMNGGSSMTQAIKLF